MQQKTPLNQSFTSPEGSREAALLCLGGQSPRLVSLQPAREIAFQQKRERLVHSCFRVVGPQHQSTIISGDGFIQGQLGTQGVAEIIMVLGKFRTPLDRLPICGDRLIDCAALLQQKAKIAIDRRPSLPAISSSDRTPVGLLGFSVPSQGP
jgi:hypothetical protein